MRECQQCSEDLGPHQQSKHYNHSDDLSPSCRPRPLTFKPEQPSRPGTVFQELRVPPVPSNGHHSGQNGPDGVSGSCFVLQERRTPRPRPTQIHNLVADTRLGKLSTTSGICRIFQRMIFLIMYIYKFQKIKDKILLFYDCTSVSTTFNGQKSNLIILSFLSII